MKRVRILPEICPSTLCPFSSSTENMAFGNASTTVPSTAIASCAAGRGPVGAVGEAGRGGWAYDTQGVWPYTSISFRE
jgi:hypothetical protein